jgi:hypothetical protein
VPEFTHAGVDDGIAGLAALPGPQRPGIGFPRKGVERGLQVALGQIGNVEQQMPAEFTPAQFAEEFVDVTGELWILGGGKSRGVPDLPRADLAKAQMRRQS